MATNVNNFAVEDPNKLKEPYKEGNDWALPYDCRFLSENSLTKDVHHMLQHVNCSYLSTPGRPPTLAALKKHAQSLTVLISRLAPSSYFGEINAANQDDPDARHFVMHEAYDFLNNLSEPYNTADTSHHRPLNSLVNLAKSNSDLRGLSYHCPLEVNDHPVLAEQETAFQRMYADQCDIRPFRSHENLLRHANECLEMLDHEFSATGGILSILPMDNEIESGPFAWAQDTLIGQLLFHIQMLTIQQHDMERELANQLDLMAGESFTCMQHLSVNGPDARSGRTIVLPQDRWILANAGDDVQEFIHQTLDKKEMRSDNSDYEAKIRGGTSEALDGANEKRRGIVHLDLMTRYYRMRGDNRGTLFILPAFADRPSTKHTRDLEKQPKVVTVPTPKFPERLTELEKRVRGMDDKLQKAELEVYALRRQNTDLARNNDILTQQADNQRARVEADKAGLTKEGKQATTEIDARLAMEEACNAEKKKLQDQVDASQKKLDNLMPNDWSYQEMKDRMPRDVDGKIKEDALKSMLGYMRKMDAQNEALRQRVVRAEHALLGMGPDATGGKTESAPPPPPPTPPPNDTEG